MRFIHFFLTCFISTFTMLSAPVKDIPRNYAIAFGLWLFFALCQQGRIRRIRARQRRAYLFEQYMRMQLRKGGYWY
jgi:hypothetical protein